MQHNYVHMRLIHVNMQHEVCTTVQLDGCSLDRANDIRMQQVYTAYAYSIHIFFFKFNILFALESAVGPGL